MKVVRQADPGVGSAVPMTISPKIDGKKTLELRHSPTLWNYVGEIPIVGVFESVFELSVVLPLSKPIKRCGRWTIAP